MRSFVAMRCVLTASALAVVAGCSSLPGSAPALTTLHANAVVEQSMTRGGGSGPVNTCPQGQELYFISDQLGKVDLFAPTSKNGKPCWQVTGLSEPAGIAVDTKGTLYVADELGADIPEYKPPYTHAFRTLRDAGQNPSAVVQCNGFTAVSNFGTAHRGKGTVSIYEGSATTPTRVLDDPKAQEENAITCDDHNDIFTTYYDSNIVGHVNEFVRGMQNVKELTGIPSVTVPGGIDWDSGLLYVGDPIDQIIIPYAPPFTRPGNTIHLSQDFGLPVAFKVLGSDQDVLVAINVDATYHGGYQVYSVANDLDASVHIFSQGFNLPAGAAASHQDAVVRVDQARP